MAKKKKSNQRSTDYKSEQELLRQQWTLRLTVSGVYLFIWIVSVLWLRWNFPNPVTAELFSGNSKSLWFMNIGLAIVFVIIQIELSKRFKQKSVKS